MNNRPLVQKPRYWSLLLCSAALTACGGGNTSPPQQIGAMTAVQPVNTQLAAMAPVESPALVATTSAGAAAPLIASVPVGAITDVKIQSQAAPGTNQTSIPVTFGQVFAAGDLGPTEALSGKLADGTTVPLQVDVKAKHADGSVRHAVISAVVPNLAAGQTQTMSLVKGGAAAGPAADIYGLFDAGFMASVEVKIGNETYIASADELLKLQENPKTWLAGATATEWHVSAPLKLNAYGAEHPHLTARFAIRWYNGARKARIDVTLENNWAYQPNPQNFTYDAKVLVGGTAVYTKNALTHLHHARWRKVFWMGEAPLANVKHNTAYLIASKAVPNYDQSVVIPESVLAGYKTKWTGAITEPMAIGLAAKSMGTTGGRPDLGLLTGWAATYLLSMDSRAKDVTMGTADLAGSWSSHYRDKLTDRPVSVLTYPYMTILGRSGDAMNRVTGKSEAFPGCATAAACSTPYSHDSAHQPAFSYLPYLVSGDYYHLEELQFWAMYNSFSSNPAYRQYEKGLLIPDQIRGQAWSLRTLGEVAYITPDSDPLKSQFNKLLSNNLKWYTDNFPRNPGANKLGLFTSTFSGGYSDGRGIAPWQDDFFTAAVGRVAELGFGEADELLKWKTKFSVSRMLGEGACWIDAAKYTMIVRDTATGPVYNTIGEVYRASHDASFNLLGCDSPAMAAVLNQKLGEMTGSSTSTVGYPSNMQPALAYSVAAAGAPGQAAWDKFMSRSVKPDYRTSPQFAIVPR